MRTTRVVLAGASGMVGGIALKHCLAHDRVAAVTVIGRRPLGVTHPKLSEVIHTDFSDFTDAANHFNEKDLALFCVGAYSGAVPDDVFRRITVDCTVAFAKALLAGSPQAAFCLLSGQGADPSEKSRVAFARYKGMAENALLGMGFPRVHLFRPGYIYPVTPRQEPNLMYTVSRWLYPLMRRVVPNIGISSEDLAKAMVTVGLNGRDNPDPVLENRAIRAEAAL